MRSLFGFGIALLLGTGLFAQNHSGFVNTGGVTRGFGSVVQPAGTSAMPGVQRTTGSVVHPAGGTQIGIPGIPFSVPGRPGMGNPGRNGRNNGVVTTYAYPVAYPVYVGGGYDQPPAQQMPVQQQPNVIVIYPPAPAYPAYPAGPPPAQPAMIEVPQGQPAEEQASATGPTHYLIAFKDHSIYSAVAYWVDGETLHYFTTGNTHNQIAVSQIDRDLTRRLNENSGLEVKLPPVK